MTITARQLIPLLLAAFVVGGLFRLHNITGIGFYRMFATIGIVVIGWLATRIVQRWQLDDASAGMQEVIDGLPEGWQALERGAPIGVLGWQGYFVGPEQTFAVTTLATANYMKGRRLRGQMRRGVARAVALAEVAPAKHVVFPIVPAVVLLRRVADDEARGHVDEDVALFDIDGLAAYFAEPETEPSTTAASSVSRSNNPPMA